MCLLKFYETWYTMMKISEIVYVKDNEIQTRTKLLHIKLDWADCE